jgi:hypothetical protein
MYWVQVNSFQNQVSSLVCSCQLSTRPLGLLFFDFDQEMKKMKFVPYLPIHSPKAGVVCSKQTVLFGPAKGMSLASRK